MNWGTSFRQVPKKNTPLTIIFTLHELQNWYKFLFYKLKLYDYCRIVILDGQSLAANSVAAIPTNWPGGTN